MKRKIIGVTVGTPHSTAKIEEQLKPVKSVNGVYPDETGNVNVKVNTTESIALTVTDDGNGNVTIEVG